MYVLCPNSEIMLAYYLCYVDTHKGGLYTVLQLWPLNLVGKRARCVQYQLRAHVPTCECYSTHLQTSLMGEVSRDLQVHYVERPACPSGRDQYSLSIIRSVAMATSIYSCNSLPTSCGFRTDFVLSYHILYCLILYYIYCRIYILNVTLSK